MKIDRIETFHVVQDLKQAYGISWVDGHNRDTIVVKMLGLGLAVSVLIDATVVRLLLVPAVMTLLGRAAWWTPRRLDRIMPHVGHE